MTYVMTYVVTPAALLTLLVVCCTADVVPEEAQPGWISNTATGFTQAQKKILVDGHNHFRGLAAAGNMERMIWDEELEATAQAAADKCLLRHTSRSFRRLENFHYAGENIHATTAKGFLVDGTVPDWWSEIKNFNLTTNKCTKGKQCGHYTQVMWASSYAVGCGVRFCDPIIGWGTNSGFILFCMYGPGGNIGRRKPFIPGPPCSNCPPEAPYCEEGLCASKAVLPLLDPNMHCQDQRGNHSFLCLNPFFYHNMKPTGDVVCEAIYCSVSESRDRCEPVEVKDGLACGVGKMCREGRCQFDNSGATLNKTADCLFGDQWEVLDWHEGAGRKIPCEIYLNHHGSGVCSSEGVRQLCCQSCAEQREDNNPDCPYGDEHRKWCHEMLDHHGRDWLCSFAPPAYAKTCCGTCGTKHENHVIPKHDSHDDGHRGDDDDDDVHDEEEDDH